MLEKFKDWLCGGPKPTDLLNRMQKNKKMTVQEKWDNGYNIMDKYLKEQIQADIDMAILEMHFEYFTLPTDPEERKKRYTKICKSEADNHYFVNTFGLAKFAKYVIENGLDVDSLPKEQKNVISALQELDDVMKYYNYDGTLFYSDRLIRQDILKVVNKVSNSFPKKQEENQTEVQNVNSNKM